LNLGILSPNQFGVLVAVTTDTLLGVATPVTASDDEEEEEEEEGEEPLQPVSNANTTRAKRTLRVFRNNFAI